MSNTRLKSIRDLTRGQRGAETADAEHEPAAPQAQTADPRAVQRAIEDPTAAGPADIVALQKTYGNRAVSGLLSKQNVQAKLMVGPADDVYEREADTVADRVVAGSDISRQGANPEDEEQGLQLSRVQREGMPEEEELAQTKRISIQRASSAAGFEADDSVQSHLRAQQGGGHALPGGTRSFMENRFGADFSAVRVHTGGSAVQLNRDLQAQAFTHGRDIYFNAGKYNPVSKGGQRLLAHELTHIVQQGAAKSIRTLRRSPIHRRVQRAVALAPVHTLTRTNAPATQRATWGDRWRAIKAKFTWKNIKDALLKTVGGPIYQFYKVYKARKAGEEVDAFSAKDFKKYGAMLKGNYSSEYGPYIGKVPVAAKLLDLFVGEVAGVVNWLTFWFGLLGLIPGAQALLALAGTFFGISVFASLARVGLNSILDGWSSILSLYRYRQIEKLANRRTGALPESANAKVMAYMRGLGEYQVNRGGYMANLIGAAIGFATTTGANLAGGMGAVDSMRGAIDPTAQIASIAGTQGNIGSVGTDTAFSAQNTVASSGLGRSTAGINVSAAVGVTPIGEGLSGGFGEHERSGNGPVPRAGHIPNTTEAANYQSGAFNNLRQLPKPGLATMSGKLRSLLNPITAIYTIISAGVSIVRGVISVIAAALNLIRKLLQFIVHPVDSIKKVKSYFTERDAQGKTGFGRWRERTSERMRSWWNRNASEKRTSEQDYTTLRAKFEPGVAARLQRAGDDITEDDETNSPSSEGADSQDMDIDAGTQSGLENLTKENKAATISTKLGDMQSMFGDSKDFLAGAADATRDLEAEGG